MELSRVQAVLLDMDGTLVDSDAAVERSWRTWAAEYPVDPGRGPLIAPGLPALANVRRLRPDLSEAEAAAAARHQLELEYVDVADMTAAPGAHELLGELDRLGLPWAVVTSADLPLARIRLAAAGIRPALLVTIDDVRARQARPRGLPAGRPQARRRSAAVPGGGGRRGRGRGRAGGRRRGRGAQGRRRRYPDRGLAPADGAAAVRPRTRGRRRPCEPRGCGRAAAAARRRRCRCRGGRRRGAGGSGRPEPGRACAGRR